MHLSNLTVLLDCRCSPSRYVLGWSCLSNVLVISCCHPLLVLLVTFLEHILHNICLYQTHPVVVSVMVEELCICKCLLRTWNVATVTGEIEFLFYKILIKFVKPYITGSYQLVSTRLYTIQHIRKLSFTCYLWMCVLCKSMWEHRCMGSETMQVSKYFGWDLLSWESSFQSALNFTC